MWDNRSETILREGWERGDSARDIAEQIGCGRDAVIGKARRLGLGSHPARKAAAS